MKKDRKDDEEKDEIIKHSIDIQTEKVIRDALKSFVSQRIKDRNADDEIELNSTDVRFHFQSKRPFRPIFL